jgi:hyperosmotically inducible protein
MNPLHKLTWIAAAVLAAALVTGCDRNKPSSETAGQKLDRTTERAGEKMDQAAADMRQRGGEAKDKIDDAAITAKVKTAMIAEPGLKALQINVDTANGVVTLTGAVDSTKSLERATQVAQGVQGVKSVDNRLNLKSRA